MKKIKEIYQYNGTDWGDAIPIGTDAEYVDGLDDAIENALDIGQENADLIGAELTQTLEPYTTNFSGSLKYDTIGDMRVVYVKGVAANSIPEIADISQDLIEPDDKVHQGECRVPQGAKIIVDTNGYLYIDPNGTTIPGGTEIKGEVTYFV